MSAEQGELFRNTQSPPPSREAAAPQADPDPAPVWRQRRSLVGFVVFCIYICALLVLLPWWGRYWQGNGWLMGHPALYDLLQHGWVRGIISGLGVLDIWIGISEVVHYRDYRT